MNEFQSAIEVFDADNSPQGRVLREGLKLIGTLGIDRVTVAAILAEAKVARGTVYAHFGDVFGVFASAWSALGRPWLTVMMSGVPEAEIPAEYRSALVQILCAARRAPVLNEVVAPDVAAVWGSVDHSSLITESRAIWGLLMRLSIELSRPILPDADSLAPLIAMITALPDDAIERYSLGETAPVVAEIPPAQSPFDAEDDDITRRLMVAAVDVVASSGLSSASMLRVCRTARLTPGAAAPRFTDLRALHDYAFSASLADVVRQNAGVISGTLEDLSIPDQSAAINSSSLQPSRRKWRLYRQEFHLAAMTDPDLAAKMRSAIVDTDAASYDAILATGVELPLAKAMVLFTHVAAAGVGAVDALGLPLASMDTRPVFHWLFESFTGAPAGVAGR
jgi:AcrR family transcriptional regulator